MDGFRYQSAIRSCHKTAQFCEDGNIIHTCRNQNFLIYFFHTGSDNTDIIRLLIRFVGNSNTTGKVDESDVGPHWALPAIMIMTVWGGVGYANMIYTSAIQGLPKDVYEAADIDGAGELTESRTI